MKKCLLSLILITLLSSCTENYSNGERIGMITQFSKTGYYWKSYEGHLNMTQTGMNSSQAFDFSIDNDNEPVGLISTLDSAARYGWKVELNYHATKGKNWLGNRGLTNYFVTSCRVLDKTPVQSILGKDSTSIRGNFNQAVKDTIYLVIYRDK